MDPIKNLGQVFSSDLLVHKMLSLRVNQTGRTLEPSTGEGAFFFKLPAGSVGIEIDPAVAPQGALVMDFFDYPLTETFDTIIGNPPWVKHQDILPDTLARLRSTLFDRRSNIFLYFIEKCVRHLNPGGELILIVPRFSQLTAARKLNAWLAEQGGFTHFMDMGDERLFGNFVTPCVVFRYVKGLKTKRLVDGRVFVQRNGQLLFTSRDYPVPLASLFDVKVGAVSGADDVFVHPEGNTDFVCSTTAVTGLTRKAFFEVAAPQIEPHKARLMERRIRRFGEHNWFCWGRRHHVSTAPRIYVNAKTRRASPFFLHECRNYDGSMLALFPRDPDMDLEAAVRLLNAVDWDDLGFVCNGRHLFNQRSLQGSYLPEQFLELLPLDRAA